jgi:hypothetical protein
MAPSLVTWPTRNTAGPPAWRSAPGAPSSPAVAPPRPARTAAHRYASSGWSPRPAPAGRTASAWTRIRSMLVSASSLQAARLHADAPRPHTDLAQRLLAGHVQRGKRAGEAHRRLEQQGGLADAGVAADQVTEPGTRPPPSTRSSSPIPVGQRASTSPSTSDTSRGASPAQPTARGRASSGLLQRVPAPAVGTLADPLRARAAALVADEHRPGLGHHASPATSRPGHGTHGRALPQPADLPRLS